MNLILQHVSGIILHEMELEDFNSEVLKHASQQDYWITDECINAVLNRYYKRPVKYQVRGAFRCLVFVFE